jgi:hypothetical protein
LQESERKAFMQEMKEAVDRETASNSSDNDPNSQDCMNQNKTKANELEAQALDIIRRD